MFIKINNINNNSRKPQPYNISFNSSKYIMHKDFNFKKKPEYIGFLYNKFSEIGISNVKAEIYFEFEKTLAPLCKLNNFLDIVKFVKAIDDIIKSEETLYISGSSYITIGSFTKAYQIIIPIQKLKLLTESLNGQ
jgi:hypothetical protein